MPAADPYRQLARELADLRREVRSNSRGSQGAFRSFEVDGQSVSLPDVARTGTAAKIDAEAARLAAILATTEAQGAAAQADAAEAAALEAAGIAAAAGKIVYTTSEPAADPNTLWIRPPDNVPYRYDGSGWVAVQDAGIAAAAAAAASAEASALDAAEAAQQAQNTAADASGVAQTALGTAQGKNTVTYSLAIPSDTTNPGIRTGDLWYQTNTGGGTVIGTWRWGGTAWQSVVLGDAVLASLTVGKLVTGSIAAGQKIIAGPASGTHAEMSDTGFRVFADDPVDGVPNEVIRLGTDTDDYFGIVNADGSLAASVDQTGHGSFRGFTSQQWPEINATDHTGRGGSLLDILDRRPRGLIGWGARYTDSPVTNTPAGVGVFDIEVTMVPRRMYVIRTSPLRVASTVGGEYAEITIRATHTSDGSAPPAPTINSPVVGRVHTTVDNLSGEGVSISKLFAFTDDLPGDQPRRYRLLLTVARVSGSGTVALWASATNGDVIEMWVEDIGPNLSNIQVTNAGGGGAQAAAPTRQSLTVAATWARSYRSTGAISVDGTPYQGYGDSFNGAQRSLIGFQDLTGILSGATVEAVGLFLYAEHWWNNAGGTAVIGRHGYTAAPATYPAGGFVVEDMVQSAGWPKPGGRWIDLMPFDPQGWRTGSLRGVLLGSTGMSTSPEYYGRFTGPGGPSGQVPVLNITYTK